MATSRSWNNQEGQRQEKTEWHSIVAWGKLADICERYLTKGKQVYVEGRLETRNWQDKEGQTRYKTEVICETMQMLGRAGGERNGEPGGGDDASASSQRGGMPGGSFAQAGGASDDDLPF